MLPETLRSIAFVVMRFGVFASHAILVGLVPVLLLVLRPTFASAPDSRWQKGRTRVAERLELLVRTSLLVAAGATIITVVLQASVIAEVREESLSPSALSATLETSFGGWLAIRIGLLFALGILLVGRVREWSLQEDARAAWWISWGVVAVGLLTTNSFSGHAAAAEPRALGITNDVVHIGSASVWAAGIFVLAVVLPESWRGKGDVGQIRLLTPVIIRFSRLAMVAIGIAALTGSLNSFLHVGEVNDLGDTPYGQSLLVKLWIFLWVLGLGGLNHYVIRRRLERAEEQGKPTWAKDAVQTTVLLEMVAALLIIASTAILVGQPRTA